MINAILLQQMLVQQIWWDDAQLKAILNDREVRHWHAKGVDTLPQLIKARWPGRGRVLLYRLADMANAEGKIVIIMTRVNGESGSAVVGPFVRKDRQCAYVVLGDPEDGAIIAHRRVELGDDRIEVPLRVRKRIKPDWWVYLMSDAYVGIDQMYCVGKIRDLRPAAIKRSAVIERPTTIESPAAIQPPAGIQPPAAIERLAPIERTLGRDKRKERMERSYDTGRFTWSAPNSQGHETQNRGPQEIPEPTTAGTPRDATVGPVKRKRNRKGKQGKAQESSFPEMPPALPEQSGSAAQLEKQTPPESENERRPESVPEIPQPASDVPAKATASTQPGKRMFDRRGRQRKTQGIPTPETLPAEGGFQTLPEELAPPVKRNRHRAGPMGKAQAVPGPETATKEPSERSPSSGSQSNARQPPAETPDIPPVQPSAAAEPAPAVTPEPRTRKKQQKKQQLDQFTWRPGQDQS
jgi:hypothetical protein